ncbi:hypothetical protein EGW08_013418 [Elysia chlorotica]|uniref:CWH43-like N-terminal domain-containing protein n=1 Tax=Elysia chlorotica TaxID=188477 RepID=A0A3S0ZH71_ELYCH|nr:hypothetical protein EGW08_013418 [Elysia chlorotica]
MANCDAELKMKSAQNGTVDGQPKKQVQVNNVIFNLDMWTYAILCTIFPASSLIICFLTGFFFRFDEVNATMCGVQNYIPSISAVTGITPQTYLWRTSIGLQAAPRLSVCFFYYNQYRNKMHQVAPHRLAWFQILVRLNFWLNFIENCCLILVAFITNRENYPAHEKIFIVFMVSSLCYMLTNTILFKWSREGYSTEVVQNYIPSISAVTGITPQTYLWRTSIGLQAAPRLSVCFFYYNQYRNKMHQVAPHRLAWFQILVRLNFWLNFIENCCLILVAFITNRENYPAHEKIFIVFMVSSLCYMLTNTILFKWSREGYSTEVDKKSYRWKKAMFVLSMVATAGLIFFFIQHRLYCTHGAFSWFSFCEYFIAYGNMAYHFTGYLDFKGLSVVCGNITSDESATSNGTTEHVNNNGRQKAKSH